MSIYSCSQVLSNISRHTIPLKNIKPVTIALYKPTLPSFSNSCHFFIANTVANPMTPMTPNAKRGSTGSISLDDCLFSIFQRFFVSQLGSEGGFVGLMKRWVRYQHTPSNDYRFLVTPRIFNKHVITL